MHELFDAVQTLGIAWAGLGRAKIDRATEADPPNSRSFLFSMRSSSKFDAAHSDPDHRVRRGCPLYSVHAVVRR